MEAIDEETGVPVVTGETVLDDGDVFDLIDSGRRWPRQSTWDQDRPGPSAG